MAQLPENDPLVQLFLHSYPNPDRVDCPGEGILRQLACRDLGMDHPARMHIAQCSPCYREFRAFEAKFERSQQARWRNGLVAAALLLVTVLTAAFFYTKLRTSPGHYQVARVDLKSYRIFRDNGSDTGPPAQAPLRIPVGRTIVTIVLPIGCSPGEYEITVSKSQRTLFSAHANTRERNGDLELEMKADIDSSPGTGSLGIKKEGSTQREYQIELQ